MNENNYRFTVFLRPLMFMIPLLLGMPFLTYCLCAFNCVMAFIGAGPTMGLIMGLDTAAVSVLVCLMSGLGSNYALFFTLQIILAAAVCAFFTIKRRPFHEGFLACSLAYGIPYILNLRSEANAAGLSIADNFANMFSSVTDMMSSGADLSSQAANAEFYEKFISSVIKVMTSCLPGMLAVSFALGGYALMWMVSAGLRKTPLNNGHRFSQLRMSRSLMIFGVLCAVMLFVPKEAVSVIGLNGLIVFVSAAFVCGMSVIEFLLRKKVKNRFARACVHFGVLALSLISGLFAFVILFYSLLGIIDGFICVRKRVSADEEQ